MEVLGGVWENQTLHVQNVKKPACGFWVWAGRDAGQLIQLKGAVSEQVEGGVRESRFSRNRSQQAPNELPVAAPSFWWWLSPLAQPHCGTGVNSVQPHHASCT